MSKIKDVKTAKVGLSGMFGTPSSSTRRLSPLEDTPLNSKEEIEETLGEETREALREEIQRRQYLKAGRPPGTKKGTGRKSPDTIPMTFRISPEKQGKLREIALQKGLFISEILDRGIDLVIAEYEKEERI